MISILAQGRRLKVDVLYIVTELLIPCHRVSRTVYSNNNRYDTVKIGRVKIYKKMIHLFNKTDDCIKMTNFLRKTDDFIKNDRFI